MPVLDRIEFEAGRLNYQKTGVLVKRENMIAASERRIKICKQKQRKQKKYQLFVGVSQLLKRQAISSWWSVFGRRKTAEIVRKARLRSRIPKDLDEQQRLAEELAISDTIRAEQLANQEATQRRIAKVIRDEQLEAIKKQEELYKQLGDTVKDGLVDSIKAAIDDTRTLGDALASMLRRSSDQFLQLAANMAFYGNAQGTLRNAQGQRTGGHLWQLDKCCFQYLVSAVTSGFSLGGPDVGNIFNVQTPKTAGINFFANGGNPPVGRPSIVGERGPELFVPRTCRNNYSEPCHKGQRDRKRGCFWFVCRRQC